MDNLLDYKTPAKGRDPPTDKGGRGTTNNPHKHSLQSMQEYGTGRATEWKQHHADDPLAPTVAIPTHVASRGANTQKSRDPEIEDTGHISVGLLPPTVTDIGISPTMRGGFHLQDMEVNIPQPPDIISTSLDLVLITTDGIHPSPRQEDSTEPSYQAGVDMVRSPTGNAGVCPYVTAGDTPDCPDKGPTNKDPERLILKNRPTQPRQKVRSALNKTEPPLHPVTEHPLTSINNGGRQQLPGHVAQEPDGLIPDSNSVTSGCTEVNHTTSSATSLQRQEPLLEKYGKHTTGTATLLSDGANTATPGTLEPTTAETKDNEPEPILTQNEKYAIAKHQRRKARSQAQVKSSTACFALGTPILVEILGKASWKPIYLAEKGDTVVQTLPSGKIEDLTGALRTPIKTVCTFDYPAGRIDIVRMGESIITAHHHIHTTDSWMTAQQAANMGYGDFLPNCALQRVYNLCLEGGGNILINTTATLQSALTLTTAATMGCRFEPAADPQHTDSLTYPDDIRIRLGQIKGMQCGYKHFFANEVQTLPSGELHIESMRIDPPTSEKNQPGTALLPPWHHTTIPQKSSLVPRRPAQLESDTANVMGKKENRGEPDKRPPGHPDTPHSVIKTFHCLPEESMCKMFINNRKS